MRALPILNSYKPREQPTSFPVPWVPGSRIGQCALVFHGAFAGADVDRCGLESDVLDLGRVFSEFVAFFSVLQCHWQASSCLCCPGRSTVRRLNYPRMATQKEAKSNLKCKLRLRMLTREVPFLGRHPWLSQSPQSLQ